MLGSHPGRVGLTLGPRPDANSTPWRSQVFVTGRHSADGHDYRPGDTVSEAEAKRQGLLETPKEPL